jgi:hypothetical protein
VVSPVVCNGTAELICAGVRSAYPKCWVNMPTMALRSDTTLSGYCGKSANPSYSRV